MSNKLSHVVKRNLRKKQESTREQYERDCDKFIQYVKETRGTERVKEKLYKDLVNGYIRELQSRGVSNDTVHTYIVGVTQGLGLSLNDFDLEKRGIPKKGRERGFELTGKASDIGRCLGFRASEYRRLKGKDLQSRDGHLFVVLDKGKGGKRQEQYILPPHEKEIKRVFEGVGKDEYVFSKQELKSFVHANEHAARRELAREGYEYYKGLSRAEKDELLKECHRRFLHKYDKAYKDNPEKARKKGEEAWVKEMKLIAKSPVRYCRGAIKAELIRQGRQPFFDRECILLVSVLNLAHYRENVTIKNYLL